MQAKPANWTFRYLNKFSRKTDNGGVCPPSVSFIYFSVLFATKSILKKIRSIQIYFLWEGTEEHQKWALVDWKTMCTLELMGGLSLRDLEVSNEIMGMKIWWMWITYENEPWEKMWHTKYAKE